ncbi:unnamed protein product [Thlaspi arvense]|uniref:Malectin-like domain-containing protein n=1 Tax=Thlaspi arvense TaxID=13288 RepID=A0AAU9SR07_THLAR|nr:unnamed protein product [Thlaspi arvense]
MKNSLGVFLPLIAIIQLVQAQDQQGFVTLDCGLPANETSPYEESYTKLLFSSDETLNVDKGRDILIVARFVYEIYDGLDVKPKFDLYLGPNLWATVAFAEASEWYRRRDVTPTNIRYVLLRLAKLHRQYPPWCYGPWKTVFISLKNMESSLAPLLVLMATLAISHIIQAQDQQGFISLDCGLPATEQSPYDETYTRLRFSSDATVMQSGKTGRIQADLVSRVPKPYRTMRYFPDGVRNCYNLNVEKGRKHLIRATFVYGNYDGRGIKPVFDLYLGPNLWTTIDLEARSVTGVREDVLHIPTSNSLKICLVKTSETTPLISALEVRPMAMGNGSYNTESGSLSLYDGYYHSNSTSQIR